MEANNYQAIQAELAQENLVTRLSIAEKRVKTLEDALSMYGALHIRFASTYYARSDHKYTGIEIYTWLKSVVEEYAAKEPTA